MASSRDDSNRIIIAVTGANTGLGLGYCHRILRQLSTAPSSPPPDALELPLRVGHSPRRLTPTDPSISRYVSNKTPPALTLILACRSRQKAEVAIKQLRKEHELGLIGRKMRGAEERKGWKEGLEIVFEELDVDRVGGPGGVLDFSERIRNNYPHLTTLVLNAGNGAFTGLDWAGAMRQLVRNPVECVLEPNYIMQEVGRKSGDGLRGGVWGVNVLSMYILAKELQSHMARSPASLPLSPRVIYVTSSQGKADFLPQPPSSDRQLLKLTESYGASKYIGSVVSSRLDWDFSRQGTSTDDDEARNEGRKVRVLRLDPGVVHTGMFSQWLPFFAEWAMLACFYVARWFGSRPHVISTDNSALGLTYLTLTPDSTLEPACHISEMPSKASANAGWEQETAPLLGAEEASPAPSMYLSQSWRTGKPYVGLERVKDWNRFSASPEGGDGFMAECESVYREWKEKQRAGEDDVGLIREERLGDTLAGAKTD